VLALEKLQYQMNPPAVGGEPPPGVLVAPKGTSSSAPQAGHARSRHGGLGRIRLRPPLKPIAQPALPGEGVWRSLVSVHGQPAVQAAFLRPDSVHTSYLAGVVWMSSKLLRFNLHPGYDEPGGNWPVPDWIPPGHRRGLSATWNGAFRLDDAHGGFYLDGQTAGTLVNGAASEVFYRDGTMTVGSWNQEVGMAPNVVGVRQNLRLLIDNGQISPKIDVSPQFNWGATVSNAYYVFRSGIGVTATGDLVYASGDALSAHSLARLLYRAGCIRAMELDINPTWVSFMSYKRGHHPADPTPHSLLPDYQRPANRYYEQTSRDFVAAYARSR
jgi:Phosphodiester glycosidase